MVELLCVIVIIVAFKYLNESCLLQPKRKLITSTFLLIQIQITKAEINTVFRFASRRLAIYEHCHPKWCSPVKIPDPGWVGVNVLNLVLKTADTVAAYSSLLKYINCRMGLRFSVISLIMKSTILA